MTWYVLAVHRCDQEACGTAWIEGHAEALTDAIEFRDSLDADMNKDEYPYTDYYVCSYS